jgi:hypothetical protein
MYSKVLEKPKPTSVTGIEVPVLIAPSGTCCFGVGVVVLASTPLLGVLRVL